MTTKQQARTASRGAKEDHSIRSAEPGGRWPAPRFGVWAPVVAKIALALGAALVLAIIGARAGANPSPPSDSAAIASAQPGVRVDADRAPPDASAPENRPGDLPAGPAPSPGTLPDGRVVLNRAAEDDLIKLPGIGPARAKAILALRERLGRFRAPQDLLRVKGIGRKVLARMLPLVVINAPITSDAGV